MRSDSVVRFSKPLPIPDTVEYEISISADFENFESDFQYPDPLNCTLAQEEGERATGCSQYLPTDEEFTYDSYPRWLFDKEGDISGFQWFRIVDSADIRLTHDGEEIFDGTVDFDVVTSECPGHVFSDFEDHPEYGESYRHAEGTAELSE